MKIIITPAKRMKNTIDYLEPKGEPIYLDETEKLLKILKTLDVKQVQKMLGCNETIALEAYRNYQTMDLHQHLVPALLAYEGIQYNYSATHIFTDEDYKFAQVHVLILSGFYGVMKPFDGIVPYRLELNNKVFTNEFNSLYEFWGNKIYQAIIRDDRQILDLGAKQYTRIIKKYLTNNVQYVKCVFKEEIDHEFKEIGVYVKMARGEMLRYLIENKIDSFDQVKHFMGLGYHYCKELSDNETYVFIRKKEDMK